MNLKKAGANAPAFLFEGEIFLRGILCVRKICVCVSAQRRSGSDLFALLEVQHAQTEAGHQDHREPQHGDIASLRRFSQRNFLIDDLKLAHTAGNAVESGRRRILRRIARVMLVTIDTLTSDDTIIHIQFERDVHGDAHNAAAFSLADHGLRAGIALNLGRIQVHAGLEVLNALKGQVEASFTKKIAGGFTIGPKDGGYFISFTEETFNALISEYLRPATKKILFG